MSGVPTPAFTRVDRARGGRSAGRTKLFRLSEAAVTVVRPSKRRRIVKIVAWVVGLVVLLALLHLAGVDVWGWLTQLWNTVSSISFLYIVLGCLFQGLQTTLTALGWYGILRYAYPG